MKTQKLVIFCFAFFVPALLGRTQGTFQNLDFESAVLSPVPPGQYGGTVPITNALPHWSGYVGTSELTEVLQNNLTLGAASISILGPHWTSSGIIEGQYTPFLEAGMSSDGIHNVDASLSQTALLPADIRSLQIKVGGFNFSVAFAGETLSLLPIGSGSGYVVYAADVSQFAGTVGTLTLTARTTVSFPSNAVGFDSIIFSDQSAPEPGVFGLSALGALLLGWRVFIPALRRK